MDGSRSGQSSTMTGISDIPGPLFLTVKEYARMTRYHPRTILYKIKHGEIAACRVHGHWRIPMQTVRKVIETSKGAVAACPSDDA